MKKRGFTLVELLAVIAILAILVIIALPNVLKMFNDSKKNSFLTEAKTVYNNASNKYITESMKGNKLDHISSNDNTKLEMTGEDLTYYISLNSDGSVKSMKVYNGTYYVELKEGEKITDLKSTDIEEKSSTYTFNYTTADIDNLLEIKDNYKLNISNVTESGFTISMSNMKDSGFDKIIYHIKIVDTLFGSNTVEKDITVNKDASGTYTAEYSLDSTTNYNYEVIAKTEDGRTINNSESGLFNSMSCFVAGTKVKTESGFKNIEDIKIGDKVYSYNLNNNNLELKKVLNTIRSNTIDTYKVTIDGKTVEMSPKHQIYIIDKGWVRAYDLKVNDKLLDVNGKQVSISKIEYKKYDSPINTYNLTIEGNENYFVTDIQVLVHNAPSPSS